MPAETEHVNFTMKQLVRPTPKKDRTGTVSWHPLMASTWTIQTRLRQEVMFEPSFSLVDHVFMVCQPITTTAVKRLTTQSYFKKCVDQLGKYRPILVGTEVARVTQDDIGNTVSKNYVTPTTQHREATRRKGNCNNNKGDGRHKTWDPALVSSTSSIVSSATSRHSRKRARSCAGLHIGKTMRLSILPKTIFNTFLTRTSDEYANDNQP